MSPEEIAQWKARGAVEGVVYLTSADVQQLSQSINFMPVGLYGPGIARRSNEVGREVRSWGLPGQPAADATIYCLIPGS